VTESAIPKSWGRFCRFLKSESIVSHRKPDQMTTPTSWRDPGTGAVLSFDDSGMFVDDTGKGPQKGFKNDDRFSDWLHSYIEARLVEAGLHQLLIPNKPGGSPVYYTDDALNSPERLLILICGAGRIHVGVWSVGVCAYHGLRAGSVLPCLTEARRRGMEVIVLNPNHGGSRLLSNKYGVHHGMVNHTLHVFDEYLVSKNDPKRVFVIAHSMGGACTSMAIERFPSWATQKIVAIAYTDGFPEPMRDRRLGLWAFERSINWALNSQPTNAPLPDGAVARTRSAGTKDHPLTTFKAFPFIWEWFDQRARVEYGAEPLVPTVIGFDTEQTAAEPAKPPAEPAKPPPAEPVKQPAEAADPQAETSTAAQPPAAEPGEEPPAAQSGESPAAEAAGQKPE
jgi:pimeloyl-ACP methyl ester carboxylesterase